MPQYAATYVERDVSKVLELRDAGTFSRFVRLCAGRAEQPLNLTSLANDISVSHHTIRSWVDVLEAAYLVFRLPPWHENFGKRIVKTHGATRVAGRERECRVGNRHRRKFGLLLQSVEFVHKA